MITSYHEHSAHASSADHCAQCGVIRRNTIAALHATLAWASYYRRYAAATRTAKGRADCIRSARQSLEQTVTVRAELCLTPLAACDFFAEVRSC